MRVTSLCNHQGAVMIINIYRLQLFKNKSILCKEGVLMSEKQTREVFPFQTNYEFSKVIRVILCRTSFLIIVNEKPFVNNRVGSWNEWMNWQLFTFRNRVSTIFVSSRYSSFYLFMAVLFKTFLSLLVCYIRLGYVR